MDTIFTRLEEASHVGDVDSLKRLLEEDSFLLERVIRRCSVGTNPLHVAATLGHADFVGHIINQKPELAKVLNEQGLSPLHLAAEHGHLPVVKELLKAGSDLCTMREEKEGLMPLHVAVINGRTHLLKELVEACEEAMRKLTYGGETILYLPVKSNSLETLEFLISRIKDLNAKDENGNTIIHLAVARKQLSVIKLLLSSPGVDVNSVNSKGFTPLDLLLESRLEYGDLVIGEMILAAGGKTSSRSESTHDVLKNLISSHASEQEKSNKRLLHCTGTIEDIENANLKPKKEIEIQNHNPDVLVVVAVLIATATLQTALNPPGGLGPDGHAILSSNLDQFLVFDMIGIFLSVSFILLFLCTVPRKRKMMMKFLVWLLWFAIFSAAIGFTTCIYLIFGYEHDKELSILIDGWFLVLLIAILWVAIRLIIFLLKIGKMLEPIQRFFSLLVKQPFRWQQLDAAKRINQLKNSARIRITVSIVSIFFVLIINSFICYILIAGMTR